MIMLIAIIAVAYVAIITWKCRKILSWPMIAGTLNICALVLLAANRSSNSHH
jgi:hypothetical protein